MAKLFKMLNPELSEYKDRRFNGTKEQFDHALNTSSTIYVGNLAFVTSEEQIYEVFSKVGFIKRIVMGLDKLQKTPCGFCFVIYHTRREAEDCVKYINGTTLDDRPIRCDFDWGFEEGRQFGRGRSGGQVRDEYRMDYDAGRGGYGKVIGKEIMAHMSAQEAGLGGLGSPASTSVVDLSSAGYVRDIKRRKKGRTGEPSKAAPAPPPKHPRYRDEDKGASDDEGDRGGEENAGVQGEGAQHKGVDVGVDGGEKAEGLQGDPVQDRVQDPDDGYQELHNGGGDAPDLDTLEATDALLEAMGDEDMDAMREDQ